MKTLQCPGSGPGFLRCEVATHLVRKKTTSTDTPVAPISFSFSLQRAGNACSSGHSLQCCPRSFLDLLLLKPATSAHMSSQQHTCRVPVQADQLRPTVTIMLFTSSSYTSPYMKQSSPHLKVLPPITIGAVLTTNR